MEKLPPNWTEINTRPLRYVHNGNVFILSSSIHGEIVDITLRVSILNLHLFLFEENCYIIIYAQANVHECVLLQDCTTGFTTSLPGLQFNTIIDHTAYNGGNVKLNMMVPNITILLEQLEDQLIKQHRMNARKRRFSFQLDYDTAADRRCAVCFFLVAFVVTIVIVLRILAQYAIHNKLEWHEIFVICLVIMLDLTISFFGTIYIANNYRKFFEWICQFRFCRQITIENESVDQYNDQNQ